MGARISTGPRNKQDYATPADFMAAVTGRFGPIAFDLAAHAGNAKSPHYFAPVTGPEGPLPFDPEAYAMDAFDHSWSHLSCSRCRNDGRKGLLWLNCEFNDIPRWAGRVKEESAKGANILLLTPASVGTVWFDTLIASHANVYLLKGRIPFIPGEPYNKDCMLSHFVSPSDRDLHSPAIKFPSICMWDWRKDNITHIWHMERTAPCPKTPAR